MLYDYHTVQNLGLCDTVELRSPDALLCRLSGSLIGNSAEAQLFYRVRRDGGGRGQELKEPWREAGRERPPRPFPRAGAAARRPGLPRQRGP